MYRTTTTHMQADPVTCSYSPDRGGRKTVTVRWETLEAAVQRLTGRGLYQQGHSLDAGVTTVHDPNGGRWDCFKLRAEWIDTDTGRMHDPAPLRLDNYQMRRFTIVAPHVRNDGSMSDYPAKLRTALLAAGVDGWTEHETHGSWRGVREAGVTFDILLTTDAPADDAAHLAAIARHAMGAEQEAIQITIEPGVVDVLEA